jgi:hypothetical protein
MGENDDLIAERDRLRAEVARLQVSRDTGVPVDILAEAANAEQAQALADKALAWKAETAPAPAPPTATVPAYNGVSQIPRDTLQHLTAEQVNQAYHAGRLAALGAPAPPPRNGRPGTT